MIQYVLDTDHVTLLKHSNPVVIERYKAVRQNAVAITVITVEEQIQGWFSAIRQASQTSHSERLIWAYLGLKEIVQYLNSFQVLDFDEAAYSRYVELRRQGIRIGTQDLRIASIALVSNQVVVTRNQQDFSRVPGVRWENWAAEHV